MSEMSRVVVGAIALAACSPAQNGGVDSADPPPALVSADSRITMQRLPCYGTCPVYTVDIMADGTVTFTGERHVESVGTMSRDIDPRSAAALMQELDAGGYFAFADSYTYGEKACGSYHTDAQRVNMTVQLDGRTKRVEHDHGCAGAPAALRALQERIDSVAGVAHWVGRQ